MANAQQQEMDLDKIRKLQEMKQQEDEFDKHLAQTVPVSNFIFYIFQLFNKKINYRIYHLLLNVNLNQIITPRYCSLEVVTLTI